MRANIVVVDCETGDFDPETSCIIEIAAQVVHVTDGDLLAGDTFEEKIMPDRPVTAQAREVNGYNEAEWATARPGNLVLFDFTEWLTEQAAACGQRPAVYDTLPPEKIPLDQRLQWCGANPSFDRKFYKSDVLRLIGPHEPEGLHYRALDVASMAFPVLFTGEVNSLSLKSLREWAGCEGQQRHRAMADVQDTIAVLGMLCLRATSTDTYREYIDSRIDG